MKFSRLAIILLILLLACSEKEKSITKWPYGVNYEVFVMSFADGNGDGKGDFKGLTAKLDYLQDLGIGGLWLMPIMPSDTYHKYHVIDYKNIDSDFGTLDDFKFFVKEAHKRNIRIITDFVINHTGNKHPWFIEASKGMDSPYRDYYVWAKMDSIKKQVYKQNITADSYNLRKWHPVNNDTVSDQYYGYFNGLCPDLNLDNQKVRDEIVDISKFWLEEVGVDGFRLDAARHIFPDDRNEDNYAFWVWFHKEMQKIKPDVYLVGEVWMSAKEVAPYLKGLPSLFNFDIGFAIMTDVLAGKDTVGFVKKYKEISDYYVSINKDYLDATFIKNHDQIRLLSEFKGDVDKSKVAAGILLTLPGTPYLYYGEEIGMLGDKIMDYETIMGPDIYIREPFIWDYSGKDRMQTSWMEAKLSTDQTVVPFSRQKDDVNSIHNFYRKFIRYRNSNDILTFGEIDFSPLQQQEIVSFIRSYNGAKLLVVHNISDVEVTLNLGGELKDFDLIDFDSKSSLKLSDGVLTISAYSSAILK
ncbi:MAG: alpha-amylase family glycosyl hydrolase [Bacteroidota bacterium]